MDKVVDYIMDSIKLLGDTTFKIDKPIGVGVENITLKEALENNLYKDIIWHRVYSQFCLSGMLVIIIFFLKYVNKLFVEIASVESPFSKEILHTLKMAFNSLTILVILTDLVCGIIAGLCLACFYTLYKYGCEIQEENDQTV